MQMKKYSLVLSTFAFLLFMTFIGGSYPFVDVTPEMVANQLVIDAPAKANASDVIKIKVTAGGKAVEGVSIVIDSSKAGLTSNNGTLNYTIQKTMKGIYNITATKLGYQKATKTIEVFDNKLEIQCLPDKSLIKPLAEPRNVIIVIDASGSTGAIVYGEPILNQTGVFIGWAYETSIISLIDANAISIVRDIERNSVVGLVAFGGFIKKMELQYMGNDASRKELEEWIRNIAPKGADNPTDIDKGLLAAEELLNSVNGTKEIIVISDGQIHRENYEQIKNKTVDLKNKDIKIHFVQILTSNYEHKEAQLLYDKLAKIFNESVIALYPYERVSTFIEIIPTKEQLYEEQCSTKVNNTITITVTSGSGTPIEEADVSFNGIFIGMTDSSGKLDYIPTSSGLYNITATKFGEKAVKMIQVLPAPTFTSNAALTINQTINPELLSTSSNQSNETPNEIKEIPGFEGLFAVLFLFILIALRYII